MSEAELQSAVIDLARLLGWRVAHFRPALSQSGRWYTAVQADGAGFPDLVMLREGRMIVAELKAERGVLDIKQDIWLEQFGKMDGVIVAVWKPRDWESGLIEATLRAAALVST